MVEYVKLLIKQSGFKPGWDYCRLCLHVDVLFFLLSQNFSDAVRKMSLTNMQGSKMCEACKAR